MEQLCRRHSSISTIASAEKSMFGSVLSGIDDPGSTENGSGGLSDSAAAAILVDPEDEEGAALSFVNEWLGAIADATVGLLLVQIASISALSPSGCAQLVVDIEYVR